MGAGSIFIRVELVTGIEHTIRDGYGMANERSWRALMCSAVIVRAAEKETDNSERGKGMQILRPVRFATNVDGYFRIA